MKMRACSALSPRASASCSVRSGFTLIEVILVIVVIVIISAISLPNFSSSLRGNKLRSSARTINRMAKYAHSMAIMREERMTLVLNPENMEIFLGGPVEVTNTADGELDQDVLKRLGYIEDDGADEASVSDIEKEVQRFLPDDLSVQSFKKNWTDEDDAFSEVYRIHFYPNGQCEWFKLALVDRKGDGIWLEIDPISGKVSSEFMQ